ncbi:rod shape-determining protein MreC [Nocardioides fonticola]|uniref:Cell shape-determining protein MreC n=1 Tax=Nocardioides fonticola TaxID=450363 RepID=A0ABP7XJX1_9ACTN
MTLLDFRPRAERPAAASSRGRRWGDDRPPTPPRSLIVALVLASASLMTLDKAGALDPVRHGVASVVGPAETGVSTLVSPLTGLPSWVRTQSGLRDDVARLEEENAALRAQVATAPYDAARLREYDGLAALAGDLGYAMVPAHVVAMGPGQSFSDTVTIDAGSDAGLRRDLTVVASGGLVGRVLDVTRTTATVLLITDADAVVGGRVAATMDVGTVRGHGGIGAETRLDLQLVDQRAVPARDDLVVTWGSQGQTAGPFVAGVPIGRVTHVYSSVRETSQRAVLDPFVDFGSLDLVGVIVPTGTVSDRGVIQADGSLSPAVRGGGDAR